ncbi:TPA: hypothetical protein JBJ33_14335 [Legionella pneumophila]|nr:hypothetical protein [Legionella pneumophila]
MRKLIVLTSNEYIRNYFESKAFSLVNDDDCYYCALESVTYREPLEKIKNFIGYFCLDPKMIKKNTFMFNVLMLRYQKRSITFRFRFKRQVLDLKNILSVRLQELPDESNFVKLIKKIIPGNIVNYFRFYFYSPAAAKIYIEIAWNYFCIYFMGRPILDRISQYIFEKTTSPSPSLEGIVRQYQPQLVMLPTQAIDTVGNDILRLKNKYNFKTFFLIDNWDNLSSKSVFMYPPDYLGVWGQQSVEHAEIIHKIKNNRVFCLGTPRFEKYYELKKSLINGIVPTSPYLFPYILFVGCSIAFDETTALHILDDSLKRLNQGRNQIIRIIYRPHPWRATRKNEEVFYNENFNFVQLDEQMKNNYYAPKGDGFQPNLDYYPSLLANALIVVGPLTTMLLEASLLKKKVLALAYDDGIHFTSPNNALKYYKHFEGIEKIPGFYFSTLKENLKDDLLNLIQEVELPLNQRLHDSAIQYFLFQDHRAYPERLYDALCVVKREQFIGSYPSPEALHSST